MMMMNKNKIMKKTVMVDEKKELAVYLRFFTL